ncbi:hypothetical protein [Shewanella acanthi]|uniref:hypothetical protein n=1 Tax=Shewanella acanthi TaxID=2864212 RepID=UPI001C660BE5|nr:hypothetical protein [Shewanella acanthi]QYJ79401.1 hypothetical protein K0H61_02840 [Shewanella acanthi]
MNTKPLKAYQVQGDEYGCIVFATNSATARRIGGRELDLEFNEVESCRRAQWADQYAGVKGGVPPLVMVENGWWMECNHCGHKITIDEVEDGFEGSDGTIIKLVPVEKSGLIYCNQHCLETRLHEIAQHNEKADFFKQLVISMRPDLTFTEFRGNYPQCYCSATFTFEGAQYGGSVGYNQSGSIEWRINSNDSQAWKEYETKRKEAV